ncbi:hypothetical protein [Halostagnicola bangensis]
MYDRRTLLKQTGALTTVATAGLAGCLEVLASVDEEQPPAYIDRLGTDDDGWVEFGYIDWDELTAATRDADVVEEYETQLDPGEVMHGYPLEGITMLSERLTVELAGPGLKDLLRPYPSLGEFDTERDEADPDEYDSTVEDVLAVNDALVLSGSIDVEEIAVVLRETPEENTLRREYERTDTLGDYTIYAPADGEFSIGDPTLAVGDDAIVASRGEDGIEPITAVIETAAGESERANDSIEEFDWLLEHAGKGHIVFGGYGEPTDITVGTPIEQYDRWGNTNSVAKPFSQFGLVNGAVSSITFEEPATTNATFGAYYEYDTIDDSFEATLRGRLASSATERSVAVNTNLHRVLATATWKSVSESDDGNESVED